MCKIKIIFKILKLANSINKNILKLLIDTTSRASFENDKKQNKKKIKIKKNKINKIHQNRYYNKI